MLKTAVPPAALLPGWSPGARLLLPRCVRPSYRLALMAPGQRCLLWLSGRREPGVHAVGILAGVPEAAGEAGPVVELALHLLPDPVARAELLTVPAFAGAEVVRMPAGSNPSWLDDAQLEAVLDRVDGGTIRAAGWT